MIYDIHVYSPHLRDSPASNCKWDFLFFSFLFKSWFKNRRFKWRREAKEGSRGSSQRLNQRLAAAKAYMPFVYQAPCGYDTGRIQLAPCQGCCKGNLTEEPYESAFYKYPPY